MTALASVRPLWRMRRYDWSWPILLKNSILQEPQLFAGAQCISQLTLRIVETLVRWPVVARNTELRGPPRHKMRDASMDLEFLARVREKSFSTEQAERRQSTFDVDLPPLSLALSTGYPALHTKRLIVVLSTDSADVPRTDCSPCGSKIAVPGTKRGSESPRSVLS